MAHMRTPVAAMTDGGGNAVFTFGPVSAGTVWTIGCAIAAAPASAHIVASVGPRAGAGEKIAAWNGYGTLKGVQMVGGESLFLTATGLIANTGYVATISGQWDPAGQQPSGIHPEVTGPSTVDVNVTVGQVTSVAPGPASGSEPLNELATGTVTYGISTPGPTQILFTLPATQQYRIWDIWLYDTGGGSVGNCGPYGIAGAGWTYVNDLIPQSHYSTRGVGGSALGSLGVLYVYVTSGTLTPVFSWTVEEI